MGMEVWTARCSLGGSGKTVGIKDSIDIAGIPTRCGSAAVAPIAADHHANVVELLLHAGFSVVGKTNLHELAFGMTGVNGFTGTPVNPKFPELIVGGSSSGSAVAVAAGDVDIAIGTDTGGSVRLPAACCGIFGFKPSFGRVSRKGVLPQQSSLDCVGIFARTMEDLIAVASVIDPDYSKTHDGAALAATSIAFYGNSVDRWILDDIHHALDAIGMAPKLVELNSFDAAYQAGMTIISAETAKAYEDLIDKSALGMDVRDRLKKGRDISSVEIDAAERVRCDFGGELDHFFKKFDLLMTPALVSLPLSRQAALDGAQDLNLSRMLRPFNLSGHPALIIPVKSSSGKPVGLQLVADRGRDAWLCNLAKQLVENNSEYLGVQNVLA